MIFVSPCGCLFNELVSSEALFETRQYSEATTIIAVVLLIDGRVAGYSMVFDGTAPVLAACVSTGDSD